LFVWVAAIVVSVILFFSQSPSISLAASSNSSIIVATNSNSTVDTGNDYDTAAVTEGDSGNENGESTPWYVPGWVSDLLDNIKDMIQNFKDFMSGKLIYEAIQGLIVLMVDEALEPLFGAFAKSYLFSPHLAEIGVVHKGWSIFMVISLATMILGVTWLAIKVIRGKDNLKKLLLVFVICLPVIYFSLTFVNFANVGVNWLTQSMLAGTIGTEGISYQDLTGQQILKAIILGKDGITDATYEAMTLGNIVIQTPGGMFSLVGYISIIVFPLYIISVFKVIVLICLAILVSLWINYAAYTGKIEALVGYANIYLRSLLAGFLCALHFGIFVRMQGDYGEDQGLAAEIGVPPIIFASLAVIVLFIALYFLWVRPVWRAVKDPVTLGGGKAIENFGNWAERTSNAANRLGKRMGSEGLQKRSLNWAESSKRMQKTGKRMQLQKSSMRNRALSKVTGGISETMQNVVYSAPKTWAVESGSIIAEETETVDLGETVVDSSTTNLYGQLKEQEFNDSRLVHIEPEKQSLVSKQIKNLNPKYKDDVLWNSDSGKLVLKGSALNPGMTEELKKMGVNMDNAEQGMSKDGVFVNLSTKTLQKFNDTNEAESTMSRIQSELPTYNRIKLDQETAKSVFGQLQGLKDELPWVENLKLENDELLIDTEDVSEAKPYIEKMLSKQQTKVRLALPRHSKFLSKMVEDWEQSEQHRGLLKSIEVKPKQNVIFVESSQKDNFTKALEEYRKDKTPYWRTKDGKTMVIMDGVPVDHGAPPIDGLDMGSFEELQKEMIQRHDDVTPSQAASKNKVPVLPGKGEEG
jgi:hypothetical protein